MPTLTNTIHTVWIISSIPVSKCRPLGKTLAPGNLMRPFNKALISHKLLLEYLKTTIRKIILRREHQKFLGLKILVLITFHHRRLQRGRRLSNKVWEETHIKVTLALNWTMKTQRRTRDSTILKNFLSNSVTSNIKCLLSPMGAHNVQHIENGTRVN